MSFERHFIETVNRIEPDIGLKEKVTNLWEPAPKRHIPVIKYAVSFMFVVLVFCGVVIFPWNTQPNQKSASKSSTSPVQQNIFTVMVNAADKNGKLVETQLVKNKTFMVKGERSKYMWGGGTVIDGVNVYDCFYSFKLKCSGSRITKVTYETNYGLFEQELALTDEQRKEEKTDCNYLEKSGYENGVRTHNGKDYIYKPLGQKFSIDYNTNYDGMIVMKYLAKTKEQIDKGEKILRLFSDEINRTKINLTVTFSDGRTSKKTVVLKTNAAAEIEVSLG